MNAMNRLAARNSRRLLTAGLLTAVVAGCSSKSQTDSGEQAGLRVLATSGPVGDAVRNVLGEHGQVDVLMGPGIDPHLYKEKPADLVKLGDADIVFYNGLHFEGIHDTLESLANKKPVFAVAAVLERENDPQLRFPDGIDALPDPHVWHDAAVWAKCVAEIADRLAEADPQHASAYQANAVEYAAELTLLHAWATQQIASIPASQRVLVTSHDAFGYFSAAYGIETAGLKGVSTEDEIDLGRMQAVAQLVVEREIPAVFVESSVPQRIVEALVEQCRSQGHTVTLASDALFADALGDAASGADTYLTMIQSNVRTVVEALGGDFTPLASSSASETVSNNEERAATP